MAGLVERWLRAFGPGTVADIKWWLGSTVAAARKALADLDAVEVDLDGQTGYVLPDDLEATAPVEPWAALLPPLDPTTMGWFERDWYLGPHKAQLFDTNGNAGPTAWWDGRIVGGWRQTETGEIDVQLLEDDRQGRATCPPGRGDTPDRVARGHAGRGEVPVAAIETDHGQRRMSGIYPRIPSANRSARSRRTSSGTGSCPSRRAPMADFGIVWRLSEFATQATRSPCARPSVTSLRMPRIVRVTGATVTRERTASVASRLTISTGRRPTGAGRRAQYSSPRCIYRSGQACSASASNAASSAGSSGTRR